MDLNEDLEKPSSAGDPAIIRGHLKYYHYNCDGLDDRGWGCGYRTLQTMCSWILNQKRSLKSDLSKVPSIPQIQKALVDIQDKDEKFLGSKQWIGSVEVAYCLDFFYDIPSKIIHIRNIADFEIHSRDIKEHFLQNGCPIMMGGDVDCASKCVMGICDTTTDTYILIMDPHFSGHITKEKMIAGEWIKWISLKSLSESSFYNLCCPQIKANEEQRTFLSF